MPHLLKIVFIVIISVGIAIFSWNYADMNSTAERGRIVGVVIVAIFVFVVISLEFARFWGKSYWP